MSRLEYLAAAVEAGKAKLMPGLVQECLDAGEAPIDILNKGMIDAMAAVGEKFGQHEILVPEMLVAARAMKKGVAVLKPHLCGDNERFIGKMVMGTVFGDLHDIGKNLVIMMVESAGYKVVDLGIDVPAESFVKAVEDDPEVSVVGVSALLTTTMSAMQATVAALNASPVRSRFKIMVGGAPITESFAREIGADIYTADAASAGQAARKLAGK
ncbi:MAG: cobalamin-dependent protein [Oscillospiraceae bacterium]|nr:cobalamin-dependent protein [Oscillospiraceae bacterium]